jgi:hypothetical protein
MRCHHHAPSTLTVMRPPEPVPSTSERSTPSSWAFVRFLDTLPLTPSDFDELETEQARDFAQCASVVAYTERTVVCRGLLAPGVHECGWR